MFPCYSRRKCVRIPCTPCCSYFRPAASCRTASWHGGKEAVPHLPALQEAIWQDRKVHLTYQRSDDSIVERLVAPLGLVAKRSTWYLVAVAEDDVRTYRVSRVLAITLTEDTFL